MRAPLTADQQRVLELEDGDSFVLYTICIADGNSVTATGRSNPVSAAAPQLSSWARRRHI